jgi:Zn-dependent M28 family amino/carboxypeptidase
MRFFAFVVLMLHFSSCFLFEKKETTPEVKEDVIVSAPAFSADSSYVYIERQLAFGPRVPNTKAHKDCAKYLADFFSTYADTVFVQSFEATAFDGIVLNGENIIASFNREAPTRILFSAHWDSRPFADQDTIDQNKPILAANDGGSGVAVLMEMARVLSTNRPTLGIDIVLFDLEDYGQPANSTLPYIEDTYCLGSQYWGRKPHIPNYKADFGVNLDMVGGYDAVFMREQISVSNADWVSQYVWGIAARLGYSHLFSNQLAGAVTDDHLYVIRGRQIPSIDVIHFTNHSGFGDHWHTHRDDMTWISKETLAAVGKTMLQVIFEYDAKKKAL